MIVMAEAKIKKTFWCEPYPYSQQFLKKLGKETVILEIKCCSFFNI